MNKRKHLLAGALLASLGLTGGAFATEYDFSLENLQLWDTSGGGMTLVEDYSSFGGTSYVASVDVRVIASGLTGDHVGLGGAAFSVDLNGFTAAASPWSDSDTTDWFANFDTDSDLLNVGSAVDFGVVTSDAVIGSAYIVVDPATADGTLSLSNLTAGAVNSSDDTVDAQAVVDAMTSIEILFEGGLIAGDTDGDGDVDLVDLGNLSTGYGTLTGATLIDGDTDGDGDVDLVDLGNLSTNYGFGTAAVVAVPEPTSLALLGLGSFAMLRRKK